jgi:TetR/AcrR family transcriptional repressor of nem operon
MPRVKEYNKEEVLNAATHVFWERGYNGTSMNDLVEATGLNKHSMYKEFGNKDGLFVACIENYVRETTKDIGLILTRKPLSFRNIEDFFHNRVAYLSSQNCRSCMLVNTAVEQEVLCDEINKRTRKYLKQQEKAFFDCLKAAQSNGEIPEDKDIALMAKYLLCFLKGINVMGKTNPTKKSLQLLVQEVLATVTR